MRNLTFSEVMTSLEALRCTESGLVLCFCCAPHCLSAQFILQCPEGTLSATSNVLPCVAIQSPTVSGNFLKNVTIFLRNQEYSNQLQPCHFTWAPEVMAALAGVSLGQVRVYTMFLHFYNLPISWLCKYTWPTLLSTHVCIPSTEQFADETVIKNSTEVGRFPLGTASMV